MKEIDENRDRSPLTSPFAWLFIGGVVLTFLLGIVFFLTIAQQRSGDLIPLDANGQL